MIQWLNVNMSDYSMINKRKGHNAGTTIACPYNTERYNKQ